MCVVDSALQKIDGDLLRLEVQIRLLDGKLTNEAVTSSNDVASADFDPAAPMVCAHLCDVVPSIERVIYISLGTTNNFDWVEICEYTDEFQPN